MLIRVTYCSGQMLIKCFCENKSICSRLGFHLSYNKDGKLRSCSPGRAGRAMGNGLSESSCTPHEHTLCTFFIFALPALPGAKIALPPLSEVPRRGVIRIVPFRRWPRRGPMGGRQSAFKRLQIFALPALPSAKIALPPL